MADQIINPYEMAEAYLLSIGVNFSKVLNGSGGITQAQLTVLANAPWIPDTMKANIYAMIDRFNKQARAKAEKEDTSIKDAKETYNWEYHVASTMIGTTSSAAMEVMVEENPETMIRWLPSQAGQENIEHADHYGDVMTLEDAQTLGLGTRPGCQCEFLVLGDPIPTPTEG